MAALLALRHAPQTDSVHKATRQAITYLQRMTPSWSLETCDTPYIEFLLPHLSDALEQTGISMPLPEQEAMQARSAAKLGAIPLDSLYRGGSPLVHVLEAFGDRLDFRRLRDQQSPDGSYGASPAATAAVLLYDPDWNERAASWLTALTHHAFAGQQGAVPTAYPADVFDTAWSLFFLLEAGYDLDSIAPHAMATLRTRLVTSLGPAGACFGRGNGLPPDVDDTAMVIAVLQRLGQSPALDAIWRFQIADHFATFAHERISSTSANAHVLEALASIPRHHVVADRWERLIDYLCTLQSEDGIWRDKWSISPYYATMCCVLALAHSKEADVHRYLRTSLRWVVASQRNDGGWGYAASTVEESAYSLLILKSLRPIMPYDHVTSQVLRRGQQYLWHHLGTLRHNPCLWVDKDLYRPDVVIRAAAFAALHGSV